MVFTFWVEENRRRCDLLARLEAPSYWWDTSKSDGRMNGRGHMLQCVLVAIPGRMWLRMKWRRGKVVLRRLVKRSESFWGTHDVAWLLGTITVGGPLRFSSPPHHRRRPLRSRPTVHPLRVLQTLLVFTTLQTRPPIPPGKRSCCITCIGRCQPSSPQ